MPQLKANTGGSNSVVFSFPFKTKCIFLALLSFILYSNSLQNGYLLDDNLAIVSNDYVQEGVSGIGKILTTDSYISWMKKSGMDKHKLSSGRYRPLSIAVFAIEHSIFGESTIMRHLMHIICFCILILVMFWFMDKYLFQKLKGGGDVSFLAAILFTIHPIHTEVVANIKSMDEMLSLLFILMTFIFSLRYVKYKKILDLVIGMVSYLFSLLSKEYSVMLLVLLPVLFYLLGNKNPLKAFISSLPYYMSFIIYVILRINAVGPPVHVVNNDVAINPYLYATHVQTIATKFFVLGKYLYMLFIPYPLSYDYNYAQIPYHNLSDFPVIVSILLYTGIVIAGIWLLYKKNILAFPVLLFVLNIALISNFLTDISSLMGERLIFHTSFGFVMVVSYEAIWISKKWTFKVRRAIIFSVTGLLIVIGGAEIIKRNPVWINFETLTTTDVNTVPNSIMANDYAAMSFIYLASKDKDSSSGQKNFYLRQAIDCENRATHLMKNYFNGYYRLGVAYDQLKMHDSAVYFLENARSINSSDSNLVRYLANVYLSYGCDLGKHGNLGGAIQQMWKAVNVNPGDGDIWYNLGGAYFTAGKFDSARIAWTKTIELNPSKTEAINGLKALPVNSKVN